MSRPRPARQTPAPKKLSKSDATASTGESSASDQFVEATGQGAPSSETEPPNSGPFEAQPEKDRAHNDFERVEAYSRYTSTKDLTKTNAYWNTEEKN
ncbi:hypothetical protein Tco_0499258 [Tanacetum coccineum]